MSCEVGQRCQNSRSLKPPLGGGGGGGVRFDELIYHVNQTPASVTSWKFTTTRRISANFWWLVLQRQAQHQKRPRRQPPAPAPFPPPPLLLFEQRACGALFCSVALSRWRGEHHSGARPSSHRGFLSRLQRGTLSVCFPLTPTRRAVDSQLEGDFFCFFSPPFLPRAHRWMLSSPPRFGTLPAPSDAPGRPRRG